MACKNIICSLIFITVAIVACCSSPASGRFVKANLFTATAGTPPATQPITTFPTAGTPTGRMNQKDPFTETAGTPPPTEPATTFPTAGTPTAGTPTAFIRNRGGLKRKVQHQFTVPTAAPTAPTAEPTVSWAPVHGRVDLRPRRIQLF